MTLLSVFNDLETPISNNNDLIFTARPIPDYPTHRIAKNPFGKPSILISTTESDTPISGTAPIMLDKLQVLPDVNCRIVLPSGLSEVRIFTVVTCTSPEESLQDYFLHIMVSVIEVLGPLPNHKDVANSIEKLVELFRALNSPARKSIRGLWAELLIMDMAIDVQHVVSCWHQTPTDHYDFSDGMQRLEVKSSTTRIRQHHFSYEQTNPPTDVIVLIASTFVEADRGGLSVHDLAKRIRQHLNDPGLVFHFEWTIGQTLGQDREYTADHRFDYQLAKDSLRVFLSEDIPAVRGNIPAEVCQIRFVSDLSRTPIIDTNNYSSFNGLFAALWGG